MTRRKQFRRLAGAGTVAVMLTALAACGGASGSGGSSAALSVNLANHPWSDAIKKEIPAFERANNVKVRITSVTADQLSSSYNVKLNAGATDLDVMMYRPLQEGLQMARNGWLLDQTNQLTTDSAYNWDDFQESTVPTVTYKNKIYGVPTVTEREVLFYRKDLLQKAGIAVPSTFDELSAAAAKLNTDGVFGFGARGQKAPAVTQFSGFLYSHGGDFIVDGKAALNTPEAVASYQRYGDLLRDHGPVGVENMSTEQILPLFQQGKLAMWIDSEVFFTPLRDAKSSSVIDKVGVATLPSGPNGSKPYNVPSWGLAINAKTQKADLSEKFVKWATSAEIVAKLQGQGVFGARDSVWANAELTKNLPADFVAALTAETKTGIGHDRPLVVQVGRARDIVGGPITVAIQGGDVQAAADRAQADFEKFLAEDATAK